MCVHGDKQQSWEAILSPIEFAYNNMVNRFVGKTPFEIVYACSPCHVYDLSIMPITVRGNKTTDNVAENGF